MLHMLDTTTVAALLKTRSAPLEARLRALPPSAVCISALTRAELLEALSRFPAGHGLHVVVRQFLKAIRSLPWDADAADWHAQVRRNVTRCCGALGELDLMVAAHALALGAVLVTCDSQRFSCIDAPLDLVDWSRG